jgi:hypothetical protein
VLGLGKSQLWFEFNAATRNGTGGMELGPVLETIENALRADQAKMIEAE